jgi:hypothetical protein
MRKHTTFLLFTSVAVNVRPVNSKKDIALCIKPYMVLYRTTMDTPSCSTLYYTSLMITTPSAYCFGVSLGINTETKFSIVLFYLRDKKFLVSFRIINKELPVPSGLLLRKKKGTVFTRKRCHYQCHLSLRSCAKIRVIVTLWINILLQGNIQ